MISVRGVRRRDESGIRPLVGVGRWRVAVVLCTLPAVVPAAMGAVLRDSDERVLADVFPERHGQRGDDHDERRRRDDDGLLQGVEPAGEQQHDRRQSGDAAPCHQHEPTTELGPVAFADQLSKIEEYVALGRQEGGKVLHGGHRPDLDLAGYFYTPTIFTGTDNAMRICQEEIFGPVVTVMPFDTEDDVVTLANETSYGLAAGVWTRDLARAHRMASRLDAGTVWVNIYRAMSPMSPRSGFKHSGLGVEHGTEVLREYTRLKSVWINTSDEPAADPFVLKS
ncbi:MAG: aldehyde dehydrogenase family protein [Actinophytocola sp.]|nr:aldehyde dehydrogenase family protein [Actinophytocola sp.]